MSPNLFEFENFVFETSCLCSRCIYLMKVMHIGPLVKLFPYFIVDDLLFLHFGTSNEVLDHLNETGSRLVGRRHLSSIPATTVSDIAASAIILSTQIASGVSIGEDSMVYDSCISCGVQIGSQCIVVGVHLPAADSPVAEDSSKFCLPDRHCLWEVPLIGYIEKIGRASCRERV